MASGNTLLLLHPNNMQQSENPNGAQVQRVNKRDRIVFPTGVSPLLAVGKKDTEAVWETVLPATYSSATGLTFNIPYAAVTPNGGGNIYFGVSVESIASDTAGQSHNVDGYGTEVLAATAVPSTNIDGVKYVTIAVPKANFGTPAAGTLIRVKIRRVASNALDTLAGDAIVFPIEVRET